MLQVTAFFFAFGVLGVSAAAIGVRRRRGWQWTDYKVPLITASTSVLLPCAGLFIDFDSLLDIVLIMVALVLHIVNVALFGARFVAGVRGQSPEDFDKDTDNTRSRKIVRIALLLIAVGFIGMLGYILTMALLLAHRVEVN